MNEHAHDNHYEAQQEALAQAANDAAGEAAYSEVVEELRQQLADAQAENARLEQQMKDGFAFDDQIRDDTWQLTKKKLDELRGQIRKAMKELDDSQMRKVHPYVQAAYRSLELALHPVFATYQYKCDYCQAPMKHPRRAADTAGGDSQVCENCYPYEMGDPAPVPVADAPQPLAEVTLTEDEIDELARVVLSTDPMRFDGSAVVFSDTVISKVTSYYRESWQFEHEYDTPANREAIVKRRKQLGL